MGIYPIEIHFLGEDDEREGSGYFFAYLPDFGLSACSATGATKEEALRNLERVEFEVALHYEESERELPKPSSLEAPQSRVEEYVRRYEAVHAKLQETLTPPPCTCGSGAHPRECVRHPQGFALHCAKMNEENQRANYEEAEAALAVAQARIRVLEEERQQIRHIYHLKEGEPEAVGISLPAWVEASRNTLSAQRDELSERILALDKVSDARIRELKDRQDRLRKFFSEAHVTGKDGTLWIEWISPEGPRLGFVLDKPGESSWFSVDPRTKLASDSGELSGTDVVRLIETFLGSLA